MVIYILFSILAVYLAAMILMYGIPNSISDTYYLNKELIYFTLVIWLMAFGIMFGLLDITPVNWQWLIFLTGAGLGFVGAAPQFKDEFEGHVHVAGALTFAIASNLWVGLAVTPNILLSWLSTPFWITSKQRTFWAEIVCVINILLGTILI